MSQSAFANHLKLTVMNIDNIDLIGDQEETLGTAEDLTEEIILETQLSEQLGNRVRIEFETSGGFCKGFYTVNELGHETVTLESDSIIILTRLFPSYYGTYVNAVNRDWVEIDLSDKYEGAPEYKIHTRIIEGGSGQ
jgi:hypothetical protein